MAAVNLAFIVTLLAMVLSGTLSLKTLEEIKEIMRNCKTETGFDGHMRSIQVGDTRREAQCYVKCIYEKKEVLKSDGSIDKELYKTYISMSPKYRDQPALLESHSRAIDECAATVTPNPGDLCVYAFQFFDCKRGKVGFP